MSSAMDAKRAAQAAELIARMQQAVAHGVDSSPALRRAWVYGNRTQRAHAANTLGKKSAGIVPTNLSRATSHIAVALGEQVEATDDEEEQEEMGGIEDGPQGSEPEDDSEEEEGAGEAPPLQGIPVLLPREAEAALGTKLGITAVSALMPLIDPERTTLTVYLAQKHGCLYESGSGLVATEHSMLEACERMPPGEATAVREYWGYIRHCHEALYPGCEFRCGLLAVRMADGYPSPKLHHDTTKPCVPATKGSPEDATLRMITHQAMLCTSPRALSGLFVRLSAALHQLLGGARTVVVSTESNSRTLVVDARELGLDSGMQHSGWQTSTHASVLFDRLPLGMPGPRRALRAQPVSTLTPLDDLVPTLEGRPRLEVLLERGARFEPTGGRWEGRQHDPESASYAGGEASKIHLLNTALSTVEVVPEGDLSAAPRVMSISQLGGNNCQAQGKGMYKDHRELSRRGGRAQVTAKAKNLDRPANAAKLAAAQAALPAGAAPLPANMTGRELGRHKTAAALALHREAEMEKRGGSQTGLVAVGKGDDIETLPSGVKKVIEATLQDVYTSSGGTVVPTIRQLLDAVLAQFPCCKGRFSNGQWHKQKQTACRRLKLPFTLKKRAKAGEGKEAQKARRAAKNAAKREADRAAAPPKPRPAKLVAVQRVHTVYRFPEARQEHLRREAAAAEGLSLEEWEAAQEEGAEEGADGGQQREQSSAVVPSVGAAAVQLAQLRALLQQYLSGSWLEGVMGACTSSASGRANPLGWLLQLAASEPAELRRVLPAALRCWTDELSLALADAVQGAARA